MRCRMCGKHANFSHTVFRGTTPTTVRLCDGCREQTRAEEHIAAIKAASDRDAKSVAVGEFLKVLGE